MRNLFNGWGIGLGVFAGFVVLVYLLSTGGLEETPPSFDHPPSVQKKKNITALYSTTTANVRSCPSTTCKVIGTYSAGDEIVSGDLGSYVGITDISQLPEWITLNFDKPQMGFSTGYINKSLLSGDPLPKHESGTITTTAITPAPIKPAQSLQGQCETKAKPLFDSYVSGMKSLSQAQFGSDATTYFSYSAHYNSSMNACVLSIHEEGFSSKYNLYFNYYWLYNADNSTNPAIGLLSYSGNTVAQCIVNTSPCTSIDEYARLTAPYLNN